MKRIFLLTLLFFGFNQWVCSQTTDKHLEIDAMGGLAFSSVTQGTGTISGAGAGVDGYYLLDPHFGLGASIGYHNVYYNGANGTGTYSNNLTFNFLDFLAMGKYHFGDGKFRSYLLGGAGICSYTISSVLIQATGLYTSQVVAGSNTSASSVYPEISGGAGLELSLFSDMNIFVQGKYNLILSGNNSYATGSTFLVPVEGGINLLF